MPASVFYLYNNNKHDMVSVILYFFKASKHVPLRGRHEAGEEVDEEGEEGEGDGVDEDEDHRPPGVHAKCTSTASTLSPLSPARALGAIIGVVKGLRSFSSC